MNPRIRLLVEFLLVVAVFAVGIYAFYQYQLFNESQDNLAVAEDNSTALAGTSASDLANAQLAATQAAEEANATSTENSNLIASGNASATWSALVNNANQQRNYATATQVAANSANELNNANATATQAANENSEAQANLIATGTQAAANSANELDNANATSTQAAQENSTQLAAANSTSTQAIATLQGENADLVAQVSDLGQQITDLDNELADTREDLATQRAELETANNTIATQEGQIASLEEGGNDDNDNQGGGGTNTDGLVLVETSRFEMMFFDNYIIVNYEDDDYEDALDEIRDLGDDFEFLADFLGDSSFFLELAGVLDSSRVQEIMLISYTRENREIPLDDYVDNIAEIMEDSDLDIDEQDVLELGGQQVGRVVGTSGSRNTGFAQIHYIVQDGRNYWSILWVTDRINAEDRLDDFDSSVATFRVR
jgi:hypothetical protein